MTSRIQLGIGLSIIAAVTLMLELLLMRVFDAILHPEMAYLIITCAMFAFGFAGVLATFRPPTESTDVGKQVSRLAIAFALFAVALLPLLNLNPFDYSKPTSLGQLLSFGLMYLTLFVPFVLAGLIFTVVFSAYAARIQSLYAFDLCGAAIGCVAFIPFIPRLGPGGLIFIAAALSLVASVLFSARRSRLNGAVLVTAVVLVVVPFARTDGYYDFREHVDKRNIRSAKEAGELEFTRWDPIAKIDVVLDPPVHEPHRPHHEFVMRRHVAYDGGSQSSHFFAFDGDYARLRQAIAADPDVAWDHFWTRSVAASHWLRADRGSKVLIIGSAAGQETKAALLYNPASVDAVEMVRTVVDLGRNRYSEFIGNIFRDPRVHVQVGEGRTYLRHSQKRYDIIQIYSNHTSSSMAAGGGASHANYLQTVEAYMEYFTHLEDDGLLQINHHIYPRLVTTAAAAWRQLGRGDFRQHVVVYERTGDDRLPTMLVKMTPWTADELARLDTFMLAPDARGTRMVENPLDPSAGFLSDEFYSGTMSPELLARIPFRLEAPTDDRPYFNFFRRQFSALAVAPERYVSSSMAALVNDQLPGGFPPLPRDVAHFIETGVVGLLFALVLIILPLRFAPAGRTRWPGEFASLLYFACLGAGFIIIELILIQKFMVVIGYPLYTYSTVIFTMLLAAGLGSGASSRLGVAPRTRWWLPFAGTLACGLLLWGLHAQIFRVVLAMSVTGRILASAAMIFPLGFFMGMCFPLGIQVLTEKPKGAVAWAWGINGLCTTIGGLGASVMSLFIGLNATLLVALAFYALAAICFQRLARSSSRPEITQAVPIN